jgi:hypothetical protein
MRMLDVRLLGDVRDRDRTRYLGFRETLEGIREAKLPGYPLKGKRAVKEFLVALRDAGQFSLDDGSARL